MYHFSLCRLIAVIGFTLLLSLPDGARAQDEAALWAGAVSAMQEGRPEAALPNLERLVSDRPGNASYRLELGYALFQLGKLGRARYHVDLAILGNLGEAERVAARSILRDIENRRRWTGYFQFNIQPETNPGRQTAISTTTIAGLDFALNEDARAKASTSYIVSTGLTYAHPVTPDLAILATAGLWSRWNEDERLRDDILSFRLGPRWIRSDGRRLEFGAAVNRRWNADRPESDSRGLYVSAAMPVGERSLVDILASRDWVEKHLNTQDEIDTTLRLGFARAVTDRVVLRGSLGTQRRDSTNILQTWDEWSLGLGAQAFLPGGWQLQADVTAARRDWGGVQPFFGVSRLDERLRLDFGVLDRDFRIGPFVPQLRAGIEYGFSNIDIYEYENRYVTISFTRQF